MGEPLLLAIVCVSCTRTIYKKGSSWWDGQGSNLYDAVLIEAPCCATHEAVLDKLRSGSSAPWPQEPEECIMQDQQHLLLAGFQVRLLHIEMGINSQFFATGMAASVLFILCLAVK